MSKVQVPYGVSVFPDVAVLLTGRCIVKVSKPYRTYRGQREREYHPGSTVRNIAQDIVMGEIIP